MKPRRTGTFAACAIALGVLALIPVGRLFALEAAYPVERALSFFGRSVWPRVAGVFGGSSLAAENAALRRELAMHEMQAGDIRRLEEENARLRKSLGYVSREPKAWIPASVLTRGGGAAGVREMIRVRGGSLQGVPVGAAVAVPAGLVGRVVSVTPHTAEVRLLTDPAESVACETENGRVRGIVAGVGGGGLVLRHVRTTGTVPSGARVVSSGLGGVYPRGLAVGVVQGCGGEVVPSVDFSSVEDVFIRRDP